MQDTLVVGFIILARTQEYSKSARSAAFLSVAGVPISLSPSPSQRVQKLLSVHPCQFTHFAAVDLWRLNAHAQRIHTLAISICAYYHIYIYINKYKHIYIYITYNTYTSCCNNIEKASPLAAHYIGLSELTAGKEHVFHTQSHAPLPPGLRPHRNRPCSIHCNPSDLPLPSSCGSPRKLLSGLQLMGQVWSGSRLKELFGTFTW